MAATAATGLTLLVLSPLALGVLTAGIVGVLFAASAPRLAVLGWTVVVFVAAVPRIEPIVQGLPILVGLILILRMRRLGGRRPPIGVHHLAVALVVWLSLSLSWARSPSAGWATLAVWWTSVVALAVVADVSTRTKGARGVAIAFTVGAALSAGLGLTHLDRRLLGAEAPVQAGDRLVGGLGDPNTLAAAAIPAAVIGAALLLHTRGPTRVLVAVATGVTVAGFLGTQSRGGLLAAVVVAAIGLLATPGSRRRLLLWAVPIVLVLSAAMSASGGWNRVTTADDARATLWAAAADMAADRPLTGVGLRNFSVVSRDYADRTGPYRWDVLVLRPKVAHNTYLQLLAETGAVGLGLFAATMGAALRAAFAAASRFAAAGRDDLETLARCVGMGLAGYLSAAMFLTIGSEKPLWILAGLAVGLERAARRSPSPEPAPEPALAAP